jgi:hypothetical protein
LLIATATAAAADPRHFWPKEHYLPNVRPLMLLD